MALMAIKKVSEARTINFNDTLYFVQTPSRYYVGKSVNDIVRNITVHLESKVNSVLIMNAYTLNVVLPSFEELDIITSADCDFDSCFLYVDKRNVILLKDLKKYLETADPLDANPTFGGIRVRFKKNTNYNFSDSRKKVKVISFDDSEGETGNSACSDISEFLSGQNNLMKGNDNNMDDKRSITNTPPGTAKADTDFLFPNNNSENNVQNGTQPAEQGFPQQYNGIPVQYNQSLTLDQYNSQAMNNQQYNGMPMPNQMQSGMQMPNQMQNGMSMPNQMQSGMPMPYQMQNGMQMPNQMQNGMQMPNQMQSGMQTPYQMQNGMQYGGSQYMQSSYLNDNYTGQSMSVQSVQNSRYQSSYYSKPGSGADNSGDFYKLREKKMLGEIDDNTSEETEKKKSGLRKLFGGNK